MILDPTVPSLPSWAECSVPQDIFFLYRSFQGVSPFQMSPEHWDSRIITQARLLCWACGTYPNGHLCLLSCSFFMPGTAGVGGIASHHSARCVRCVGLYAPLTPGAFFFSSIPFCLTSAMSNLCLRGGQGHGHASNKCLVLASDTLSSL